ncbi:MAG: response regulator [Bacteroidales bacterium]|nr:response regulator [Bacteroidales bacterium]
MPIKVLIVDDHPVFLAGLCSLLESTKEIEVIGEAGNGLEAIKLQAQLNPDIIVMDINMPGMDGIEATRKMLSSDPNVKILALSIHSGKRFVKNMLEAGASGYLLKESAAEELVAAIQKIVKGEMYLSSSITKIALEKDDPGNENKRTHVLYTKLHRPPLTDEHIYRYRLIEKLNYNLMKPLSLVCAPAGYGKSMLLSSWLEKSKCPNVWISLSEDDNELWTFLNLLIAGINKIFPESMKNTGDLLKASELPPIKVLSHSLINDIDQIKKDFVIVLDDYHLILEKSVHEIINELLKFPPKHLHLSILTRRDPPLNINVLRVHGQMLEIRMNSLSFNKDEVISLFQKLRGIKIDNLLAETLETKTEGWIAGLKLASLIIENLENTDEVFEKFGDNVHSLSEFMVEELIANQVPEMQDLLIKTSIFKRFCAELIDSIFSSEASGNMKFTSGGSFIQWLAKSELFVIPLDRQRKWFRYHHLFQELLNSRLKKKIDAKSISRLHENSAKWFNSQDLVEETIHHMLMANNPKGAAEIIESHRLNQLNSDNWFYLARWLNQLPKEISKDRPGLLMLKAWICYERSQVDELVAIVQKLEELLKENTSNEILLGELYFFKGYFQYFQDDDLKSLEYLEKALQIINGRFGVIQGEVELMLGLARLKQGKKELAVQSLNQSLANVSPSEPLYIIRLLGGLAFLHMVSGDISGVERDVARLKKYALESGKLHSLSWANYLLAWVDFQRFEMTAALIGFNWVNENKHIGHNRVTTDALAGLVIANQILGRSEEATTAMTILKDFANHANDPECLIVANSCQAQLALMKADMPSALKWARSFNSKPDISGLWLWLEAPLITKARILIAEGSDISLLEATELLTEMKNITYSAKLSTHQIDISLLQALILNKQGKTEEAIKVVEEDLELAFQHNWVRPFLMAGNEMYGLLLKIERAQNPSAVFIEQLIETFRQNSANMREEHATDLLENQEEELKEKIKDVNVLLSFRELDVLASLAQGLRNKEIGEQLFITEYTVKKHLSNIYGKFNVKNRVNLLKKAKDQGLIN